MKHIIFSSEDFVLAKLRGTLNIPDGARVFCILSPFDSIYRTWLEGFLKEFSGEIDVSLITPEEAAKLQQNS